MAAAVSENGSEDSSAVIFEVASGKKLADVVPRVNFATAGGSIDWKEDSSGFYYTRYPQGKERPAECLISTSRSTFTNSVRPLRKTST